MQVRHRGKRLAAVLDPSGSDVEVRLLEPALGVAPGQSAVFYAGDEVHRAASVVTLSPVALVRLDVYASILRK